MMQWTSTRIAGDWASYKVSARLMISQLHRHILAEGAGIAELLNRYGNRKAV